MHRPVNSKTDGRWRRSEFHGSKRSQLKLMNIESSAVIGASAGIQIFLVVLQRMNRSPFVFEQYGYFHRIGVSFHSLFFQSKASDSH